MAYITQAEMVNRFGVEIGQIVDRNNDGQADAGVFDAAAADADAVINGYCAARYTLPFASTPALIKELAADITRYELWDDKASEEVRKRYEDAISRLKDIAKGLIVLPDADGAVIASGVGTIESTTRTRTFDDCTLRPFMDSSSRFSGF